jgi:hypothetical protein
MEKFLSSVTISDFFIVIFSSVVLILISMILDIVWAPPIPYRTLYYWIRAPGVIVHEYTHIVGCLIMGAKIQTGSGDP